MLQIVASVLQLLTTAYIHCTFFTAHLKLITTLESDGELIVLLFRDPR